MGYITWFTHAFKATSLKVLKYKVEAPPFCNMLRKNDNHGASGDEQSQCIQSMDACTKALKTHLLVFLSKPIKKMIKQIKNSMKKMSELNQPCQ